MRSYSVLSPTFPQPQPPDNVSTLLLAAGVGQALDWTNSTGGAGSAASSVGAQIVRFTGMSTANAPILFMVNLVSTHANVPTSGTSATTGTSVASTGNSIPVWGSREFQIPSWSTGWSAAALTSGYVIAETWRK